MGFPKIGRRLFLQSSAATTAKKVAASQAEKINPVSKLKTALKAYGDATSAKKMARLAQGDQNLHEPPELS